MGSDRDPRWRAPAAGAAHLSLRVIPRPPLPKVIRQCADHRRRACASARHVDEHDVTLTTNALIDVCTHSDANIGKMSDGQHPGPFMQETSRSGRCSLIRRDGSWHLQRETVTGRVPSPSTSAEPDRTASLDCRAIDTVAPPSTYPVVDEVVALQLRPQHQPAQNPAHPGWPLFVKTGLGVRADRSAELAVPPENRAALRIGWGSPAEPSLMVTVSPCPGVATPTGWLRYPGGYWVKEPGCYPLELRTAQTVKGICVPIGAPCC